MIYPIEHAEQIARDVRAGFEADEDWTVEVEPTPAGTHARVVVYDEDAYRLGEL